MRRLLPLVLGLPCLFPAVAHSQGAPSPAPPRVAATPLVPPNVELGEIFGDDEWGFELRLPTGMVPLPPDKMEEMRRMTIAPPEERTDADGNVGKIQVWKFESPTAAILIRANEPPTKGIDSPIRLRREINEPDRLRGRAVQDHGKLYEFKARGARTGFLVTRDVALEPGRAPSLRQHSAFLRGASRSYILQYMAPLEQFDEQSDDFQAAVCTFAILQESPAATVGATPARAPEGIGSGRFIANVTLAVLLVLLLVYVLRRKAPDPAADVPPSRAAGVR